MISLILIINVFILCNFFYCALFLFCCVNLLLNEYISNNQKKYVHYIPSVNLEFLIKLFYHYKGNQIAQNITILVMVRYKWLPQWETFKTFRKVNGNPVALDMS